MAAARYGRRVAALVVEFGEALKLGPQALQSLRAAGLFHDLGMLGLRRERLYTPWAELSENERSLMLSHPEIGASQLELVPEWALTRAAVIGHLRTSCSRDAFPSGLAAIRTSRSADHDSPVRPLRTRRHTDDTLSDQFTTKRVQRACRPGRAGRAEVRTSGSRRRRRRRARRAARR